MLLALVLVGPALAGATAETSQTSTPATDADTDAQLGPTLSERLEAGGSQEVILTLAHEGDSGDWADLRATGLTLLRRTEALPFVLARGPAEAVTAAAELAIVEHVAYNEDMRYALNTATEATRADDADDAESPAKEVTTPSAIEGITGDDVGIAVVDSGIDATHEDLTWHSKVLRNFQRTTPLVASTVPDVASWKDSPDTDPASGHGTHVAGIAGGTGEASDGKYVGTAPGASLYGFGMGVGLSIFDAIEAFDFILRNRGDRDVFPDPVEVVTNSWGSCGEYDPDGPYAVATQALVDAGMTVVYAAGNQGVTCPTHVTVQSQHPAPGVVSVANYDDKDKGTREGVIAPSSSIGFEGNRSTWPDVAAPGTDIVSTAATTDPLAPGSTYTSKTGTSMAAPHAAGVVALLMEADPSLTPAQVEQLLISTSHRWAQDIDPVQGHIKKGHGLVDAYEALHAVTDTGRNTGIQARSLTQNGTTDDLDRTDQPVIANETLTLAGDGLFPKKPPAGPSYSGTFHVYQGGVIDAFGVANILTGRSDQGVVAGTKVGLSIRSVTASNGAERVEGMPVTFTVRDAEGTVAFQKETNLEFSDGSFGPEYSATVAWNVSPTRHAGDYQATVTVDGIQASGDELTVVGPARDAQDAKRAAKTLPSSPSTGEDSEEVTTQPTRVRARLTGGDWVNGTVTDEGDGTFTWNVSLDPTDTFPARIPVQVQAVKEIQGGQNLTINDTLRLHREPVPSIDAPEFLPINEDVTLSAEVPEDQGPATFEWDLDYDGQSFEPDRSGASVTVSFADPRTRTVAVQATDESGATGGATHTIQVAKPIQVVDATRDVNAGGPDEIVAFELNRLGLTGPKSADADSYWVDVGQYPDAVRLSTTLSWGFHEKVEFSQRQFGSFAANANDFDLLFRVPDGENNTEAYTPNGGATASMPETAHFDNPTQEDWRIDVSPFLVAKPDTYHLETTVWVSE